MNKDSKCMCRTIVLLIKPFVWRRSRCRRRRGLLKLPSKLSGRIWDHVQEEFGGDKGHSCDLMSLDSNAMKDQMGNSLPHFTPVPSPDSAGVNLFAQDLSQHDDIMSRPYVLPLLYWLDQY